MAEKIKENKSKLNKKAGIALLFNVLIGLIFIVISFFLFLGVNSIIENINKHSIHETQNIHIADSYAVLLAKLEKDTIQSFSSKLIYLKENDENFFAYKNAVKEYGTFAGDLAKFNKESDFLISRSQQLYIKEGNTYPLRLVSSINEHSEIPKCPFNPPQETMYPMPENQMQMSMLILSLQDYDFEENYCRYYEHLAKEGKQ